jgi:hypothetical protein
METALIIAVLVLGISFYTRSVTRRSDQSEIELDKEETFFVSKIWYLLGTMCGLIGVGIGLVNLTFPRPDLLSWIFFGSLGGLFVIAAILGVRQFRSASVVITSTQVFLHYGSTQWSVERADIKRVYVATGYIVIDCGVVPRRLIPLVFRGNARIVALLRQGMRR